MADEAGRDALGGPPYRTYGSGLAIPCIVPARCLELPEDFSVVAPAGHTLGMLLYIEYAPPSPVTHRELIWLSAIVRCTDRSYEPPKSFGPLYHIARIYGDNLEATDHVRRNYALPKSFARFHRYGNHVQVSADDGTEIAFSFRPLGLTFQAPTNLTTLQKGLGRVMCFRARGRAQVQLATYKLERFESDEPEWQSFKSGLVLPGLASHIKSFDTVLHAPYELSRRLESIAPQPSMV
jgi:hypothetical protein